MGGSSSQVIGYKYYCGLMVAIGNTIEKVVGINPDNRGWLKAVKNIGDSSVLINEPELFGGDKQEGGWVGYIDVHTGRPETLEQNHYLAQHDSEIVSAFPNLSYLVYHGLSDEKGFHVVSMSGAMKEVLYWVKRIHIKNNGDAQWYDSKAEIPTYEFVNDGAVSETVLFNQESTIQTPSGTYKQKNSGTWNTVNNLSINPVVASGDVGEGGKASITDVFTTSGNGMGTLEFKYTHLKDAVPNFSPTGLTGVKKELYEDDPNNILITYLVTAKFKLSAGFTLFAEASANDDYDVTIAFENIILSGVMYSELEEKDGVDINPIHKIREILTDDTAMNKPESDVNDINFTQAASRIWDEKLGISWAIQEKTCKEAIDELLYHIEAGIRVNRQTGKYEVILFRDDLLNLNTAMQFNESNIKSLSREVANQDDVINVLNVKYYDRESIKESAFNVYENGSIMSNGNQEIAESVDFPYFMNRRNAELVANWKLKQLSTPTWKGSFSTGKYEARKLNKYDVIKLSWLNAGFVDMPVRVMKISLGDGLDNTVSIDWVEVVSYSSIEFQPIFVDPPTNQILLAQPNLSKVFEMPYFEAVQNFGQTQTDAELANNPDLGYLMIATKKPQNNSLNAQLYTDDGAGYKQQATINYCPTAILDQNIDYLDTSFSLKNVDSIVSAEVGSCIIIDDEILVYQSYNETTKILTVKRGALDTVPKKHNASAVLFFYDAYPSFDKTQYVDNETVNAKSLTTTPSSVLDIYDALELPLEFNARAIRPYPPANVKIDGIYYKKELNFDQTEMLLTWNSRNRLQQTGGSILGWVDGSVSPEPNLTYAVSIYSINNIGVEDLVYSNVSANNSISVDISEFNPMLYRIEIESIVNNYRSYQKFSHILRKNDNTVNFIIDRLEVYIPKLNNAVNFEMGD